MYTGIYQGSKKHQPDLIKVIERSIANGLDKVRIIIFYHFYSNQFFHHFYTNQFFFHILDFNNQWKFR